MLTILIRKMLKVFWSKISYFFIIIYCNAFDLVFCFVLCFFFGSQTDYSLILYYKAKS